MELCRVAAGVQEGKEMPCGLGRRAKVLIRLLGARLQKADEPLPAGGVGGPAKELGLEGAAVGGGAGEETLD
jgi:hypothetical protein